MQLLTSLSFVLFFSSAVMLVVGSISNQQQQEQQQDEAEIESALTRIFSANGDDSIQVRALRNDIVRRLYDALVFDDTATTTNTNDDPWDEPRWSHMPPRWYAKRNLAALAKGGYIKTIPDQEDQEQEQEEEDKRSLASLVKNGQLPHAGHAGHAGHNEQMKRGIQSLARDAHLLYGKRYLGSLMARNRQMRFFKRNLAALARDGLYNGGGGSGNGGKRNVAALLRQVKMHSPSEIAFGDAHDEEKPSSDQETATNKADDKRNIGSIKAQTQIKPNYFYKRSVAVAGMGGRMKRSSGGGAGMDYDDSNDNMDEYALPVYQNQNVHDYEDFIKAITGSDPMEKRFLGSVAKSGWFNNGNNNKQASAMNNWANNNALDNGERIIDKRHIGALARLGWLPSLRMVRRFNRSGRSIDEYEQCDCSNRSTSADGQTEDDARNAANQLPVDDKRYLVQPIIDKLLLERIINDSFKNNRSRNRGIVI